MGTGIQARLSCGSVLVFRVAAPSPMSSQIIGFIRIDDANHREFCALKQFSLIRFARPCCISARWFFSA
jgi:hypothetical protein